MSTPATSAADANPASAWWHSIARASLRTHLGRAARVAVVVVALFGVVSAYLALAGTKRCEDIGGDEQCTTSRYYAFTLQRMVADTTVNGVRTHHVEWFPNGVTWIEGGYANNGARVGPWREQYANGTVRFEGTYADDAIVGDESWYFPSGALEWRIGRRHGERDGEERWYHDNGSLRRIGSYVAGMREGTFTVYDAGGRVSFTGEYLHDKNVSGSAVD